jgi:uncharacterized repeat protein (TIGR04076 family)
MKENTLERRRFLSACTAVGAALAAGASAEAQQPGGVQPPAAPQLAPPASRRRRYQIDIEIVECKAGRCAQHQLGDKFAYPADRGRMCAWLLDSMNGALRVLEYGGTMPWLYEGTPYKKVIDPDGVTTEFIRCPDPTAAGVVAKITRTKV